MIIINLFNLFAKISLDDKDFEKGVDNAGKKGKSLSSVFSGIGNGIGVVASATVKAVGAASAAVGALAGLSIKQYAEYEQLIGGVETLFKDSSNIVKGYADNAYKSAGLSANEYMSTITGFSASLLQGLGGDTKKAAEIGNKAVTDMSDNANKMGTSMEMIQNAYQGFAKQNYTMLDNLKLGYGGTKEEMQRLLADASKLSGVEYSIGNFSDIIEAIHVVQDELGITGTTAKEAATTIQGSFSAMKSAWTNVLTGMSDDSADFDTLINNLVESASTFGDNILPRIKIALTGIGKLVEALVSKLPTIIQSILPDIVKSGISVLGTLGKSLTSSAPILISSAVDIIKTLVSGIQSSLPSIVTSAMEILNSLINGIVEVLPMLLELGLQMLITLGQGIAASLPSLIPTIVNLVISLCDMIINNLPMIIDVAIDIILALVEGLVNALPTLIQEVPRIINSFADAIYAKLPDILKAGIDILLMLIKGLIDSIPILIQNLPQIIMAIVNAFTLYNWWNIGSNLITNIGNGIKSMFTNIKAIAKLTGENVVNAIKGIFSGGGNIGKNLISYISNGISSSVGNLLQAAKNIAISAIQGIQNIFGWNTASSIGSNLIRGIWAGISNMSGWIINLIGGFAGSVVKSIKGFFGIHSPSKVMQDEVGVFLAQGIGVGFDDEIDSVNKDIENSLAYDYNSNIDVEKDNKNNYSSVLAAIYNLLKTIADNGINIDGREVAKALSPYQEEFDDYNTRKPLFV